MHKEIEGKIIISKTLILLVIFIDIVILSIWTYICLSSDKGVILFVENFPTLLGSIVALSATIFGVTTVKSGLFNNGKGGTPYYPKKNKQKDIDKIILSFLIREDVKKIDYDIIRNKVNHLLSNKIHTENESSYWENVYLLQQNSEEFKLIWNDYNYYSEKVKKSKNDIEYISRLEKYIYYCVYFENNKNSKVVL
ncbi:hypothetical protein SAMN02746066_02707 [Anaerosporobacter mobilis DSM 15930]|jgi:hypothetical protein|uniref:Uncharacterized protein n=1 Tax=Anaerosporobacter mobilis DSM 15930 TaxID=1120996 RepID=A0A1M7KFQ9_9FIRM|nr:hypothetical protein [Anaerosporobacter mobilis]SHM63668.1 hypothetical protein SAMN02746066_02707 [Anaerosporobacter mobilis DSM 15930]